MMQPPIAKVNALRGAASHRCASTLRLTLSLIGFLIVAWFYFSWQLLIVSGDLRSHNLGQSSRINIDNDERQFDAHGKQDPTGGAFVHIGKTGGSTLSKLMRNGCASVIQKPCYHPTDETVASRQIHSYYHVMDFGLLPKSHHDFYLLSLRDPFDRLVSAFCYEHILNRHATNNTAPLNRFQIKVLDNAYQCFPTLEAFATYFQQGNPFEFHYPYKYNIVEPSSCRDFALAVFHGRVRIFHHLYFNYQNIRNLIPNVEQQTLLVTRLEHLWEDWKSVNAFLGQDPDTVVLPHHNSEDAHLRDTSHLQNSLPVTKELSEAGRLALCDALQLEYDAYFWLLSRARNLGKTDVAAALARARQNCPAVQLNFKALLLAS